jgi:hypothetical protein
MAEAPRELTPAEVLAEYAEELQDEYERTQRELREVSLLVEQSRAEVEKLAQRNATIASHLRQLHLNLESVPRTDLKTAYEAAADAQQRLFTMRGQLEDPGCGRATARRGTVKQRHRWRRRPAAHRSHH